MRLWGMQNPPAEAGACLPPTPPRFVHCAASTALRQALRPVTVLVFAACALQRNGSGGSRQAGYVSTRHRSATFGHGHF